jgi:hypothetical protein
MMKTLTRLLLVAALVALPAALALGETVAVDGSNTSYETKIEPTVGGKAVKMDLTGAAMRKRVFFKVYTIGSYVQSGSGLRSAEALADADVPKQLHLVMERDVDGKEMVDAVEKAIHNSRGNNAFADELKTMRDTMKTLELKKGDNIRLTNVPKKGLSCDVAGKKQILIENSDFSKAVWEIYLGKKNIDDDIKKALVSRL